MKIHQHNIRLVRFDESGPLGHHWPHRDLQSRKFPGAANARSHERVVVGQQDARMDLAEVLKLLEVFM
jgi:hypothetical protein